MESNCTLLKFWERMLLPKVFLFLFNFFFSFLISFLISFLCVPFPFSSLLVSFSCYFFPFFCLIFQFFFLCGWFSYLTVLARYKDLHEFQKVGKITAASPFPGRTLFKPPMDPVSREKRRQMLQDWLHGIYYPFLPFLSSWYFLSLFPLLFPSKTLLSYHFSLYIISFYLF